MPRPEGLEMSDAGAPSVLVVDDDPVMRIYASERLAAAGFSVHTVEDGPRAVTAVHESRPDLVVLDVQMPGMDGYEVCRRIRACPEGKHTPVLMLTALDDMESIGKAYEARATDFASKPANWTLLAHRLEYLLRSSRSALELRRSQARLANAQRIARLGYWEWSVDTDRFVVFSQLWEILGVPALATIGTVAGFVDLVDPEDRESVQASLEGILQDGESRDLQFRMRDSDGELRSVRQRIELASDEGEGERRVSGVVLDVTDQRRAEERARFLTSNDGLTQLLNRRGFSEPLRVALAEAERYRRGAALLLVGLDRFTRVNETLGREAGDAALRTVAARLRSFGASHPVARIGGDEFALLLSRIATPREAAAAAERLSKLIAEPISLAGTEVVLASSIGISVYPEDGSCAEILLANAEAAMHNTRERGGDGYQYYSKGMNENTATRLALETGLSRAVERGELVLEYQPQYDTRSGRIVGAEALIRWHHPERGVVAPAEFIPIAEESGAIAGLGEWALYAACIQAKEWQRDGLEPVCVSVNVSGRQFERPEFPETVHRALSAVGLEPQRLSLELTESVLLEDSERAIRLLERLKSVGVGLSLDDFGTGYSSLSYLMRLPLDALKIDRSFLSGVPQVAESRAITRAIIALARSLRMEVVAEGVENREQVDFLRRHGCDTLQGFLLGRPLPAGEFGELLRQSRAEPAVSSAA